MIPESRVESRWQARLRRLDRLHAEAWFYVGCLIVFAVCTLAGCPTRAAAEIPAAGVWQTLAKPERVLYVWTMENCPACKTVFRDLETDPQLRAAIPLGFDRVQAVPWETNQHFAFGISAFPTFCVGSPTSAQRFESYRGPADLCKRLGLPYGTVDPARNKPPRAAGPTAGRPRPCPCPRCDELERRLEALSSRVAALQTELGGAATVAGAAAQAASEAAELAAAANARLDLHQQQLATHTTIIDEHAGRLEDHRERIAQLEQPTPIHVHLLDSAENVIERKQYLGTADNPIRLKFVKEPAPGREPSR